MRNYESPCYFFEQAPPLTVKVRGNLYLFFNRKPYNDTKYITDIAIDLEFLNEEESYEELSDVEISLEIVGGIC